MAARPDMTLRKVWGNIEKQKTIKGIEYPELAIAMHISVKTLYTRRNQLDKFRVTGSDGENTLHSQKSARNLKGC